MIIFGLILAISILQSIILVFSGDYFFYFVILPIFLFYNLFFELILGGLTPGKKAMGIRVIKLNGMYAAPIDYIIRWVFRWIDIWMSFFVIGSLLINSNRYGQRLGDLMAGTTVIRTGSRSGITLREILKIDSGEKYTPKYPQVTLLTDKEMLLVKTTLYRARQNPNEMHRKAVRMLVDKLKKELKIEGKIKNRENFLNTLLKDYIVLTR